MPGKDFGENVQRLIKVHVRMIPGMSPELAKMSVPLGRHPRRSPLPSNAHKAMYSLQNRATAYLLQLKRPSGPFLSSVCEIRCPPRRLHGAPQRGHGKDTRRRHAVRESGLSSVETQSSYGHVETAYIQKLLGTTRRGSYLQRMLVVILEDRPASVIIDRREYHSLALPSTQ